MSGSFDAIVIGAGHNGLVAGSYLAKAGRKVLVLEARDQPGGAAVAEEIAPGYRVPVYAHLLFNLDPVVARDLQLERHGLCTAKGAMGTVALDQGGAAAVAGTTDTFELRGIFALVESAVNPICIR